LQNFQTPHGNDASAIPRKLRYALGKIPPMCDAPLARALIPFQKSLLCSMLFRRAGSNWVEYDRDWVQKYPN
jgi:hypothetical protein